MREIPFAHACVGPFPSHPAARRRAGGYSQSHPRSQALFAQGSNLFGGVPMTWMNKWSGGFPLYLDHARGNRITDVDGHTTSTSRSATPRAMAGHSPRATGRRSRRRMGDQGGITTMLPTADAQWVGRS